MQKGMIPREHEGKEYILEVRSQDIDREQYQKNKTKEKELKFTDKRRHRRHLLDLPIQYYLAGMKIGRPGFTLNVSEEGLAIELPEKLKVGEDLKLKILQKAQGSIEIMGKIVWIKPPARKGEAHQSGVRIVKLSPENKLETLFVSSL